MKERFKVIIIGGGVAGMLTAVNARCGDILILEASSRIGKKLLATGNGKCNLLNKNLDASYYNDSPLVSSVFEKYGENALESMYGSLGLALRFDDEGRGYPLSESANTVLDVLRCALEKKKVNVVTDAKVTAVEKTEKGFAVHVGASTYYCDKLVIAIGSDAGFGIDSQGLVKGLVSSKPFAPALAPVCVNSAELKGLNGVRVKCCVSLMVDGKKEGEENGEVLFKSFGLSGIAVFDLSALYVRKGSPENAEISLNLLQMTYDEAVAFFEKRKGTSAAECVGGVFQKMLAQTVLDRADVTATDIVDDETVRALAKVSVGLKFKIEKIADKSLAQVMHGGVSADSINAATLMAKGVKDLYFAGEALDVDGVCGGYNLMWAAASAMTVCDSLI